MWRTYLEELRCEFQRLNMNSLDWKEVLEIENLLSRSVLKTIEERMSTARINIIRIVAGEITPKEITLQNLPSVHYSFHLHHRNY